MSRKNPEPTAERASTPRESGDLDRTRTIAERHQVSIRTVERWTDAGLLPPPMRIRGRKYWPAGTIAKIDAPP
jgi:MerR-like DNA binding protein